MRRAGLVASLLAALALLAPTAVAAEPKADFYDVQKALMCDTCNVALNIADSERAEQQRREIREYIAQGLTKDEILDAFVAEYGPNVLAEPRGGGASVTVWLIPALVLAVVLAGVAALLPRWRRARAADGGSLAETAPAPLRADDAARLERDLALYE